MLRRKGDVLDSMFAGRMDMSAPYGPNVGLLQTENMRLPMGQQTLSRKKAGGICLRQGL
jgi:hypothetical protein